jgi:hypothetical protein
LARNDDHDGPHHIWLIEGAGFPAPLHHGAKSIAVATKCSVIEIGCGKRKPDRPDQLFESLERNPRSEPSRSSCSLDRSARLQYAASTAFR